VDRAYLFSFSPDGSLINNTHEWCAPGVPEMKPVLQGIATSRFPWFISGIRRGEVVHAVSLDELPTEAAAEYEEFAAEGIKSLFCLPLVSGTASIGFLGLDSIRRERSWSSDDRGLLKVAGAMFVNAIERRAAEQRLRELIRAKDTFVATVSHELRTPLTTVVALTDELVEHRAAYTESEVTDFLGLISREGHEVADIVDDLLVAARDDVGTLSVVPGQFDISELVDRVVADTHHNWASPVTVEIPADLSAWADPSRVRQILRNLLTNAIRYGGERVWIRARTMANRIELEVIDSGSGVAPHEAEAIFSAYTHGSEPGRGTQSVGIGLTVSRNLARLMGGDLVYRRRAQRAVFALTLPAAAPREDEAP
jgi:signal transduction histidine kinase